MKNILVTGAAGFIGFHISKRLIENKINVIGIDNLNEYYDPQLKRKRLIQLKVSSYKVKIFLKKIEKYIHHRVMLF